MFGTGKVSGALLERDEEDSDEVVGDGAYDFEAILLSKFKSLIVNAGLPDGTRM